ncbi:mammaglobin-A-like [Rhinolophus ferrumequinum]|uniref:mammaglobin-A-like n=1 Tax=Rhinolophus ferrumequinum TaxID=59479 RepID=UPI00140F68D7|nr:mammaglobin-A-like [Rhinolophus ferrumequinum]
MKLLTVLMLIALPVSCFAGSGCPLFEKMVDKIASSEVDVDQFLEDFQEFVDDEDTANAIKEMNQFFLDQDDETLENFQVILQTKYNSVWCAEY